ncbi:MAG: PD40 domain-containing protein, partial [Candidatus Latescibacteria bacterium]|nr:PD40 domain-containing protein [Candidatus Latescibacterota bacterium]
MQFYAFIDHLVHWSNIIVPIQLNLLLHSTIIISAGLWGKYLLQEKGAVVQSQCLRICLVALFLCPFSTTIFTLAGINIFTFKNAPPVKQNVTTLYHFSSRHVPVKLPEFKGQPEKSHGFSDEMKQSVDQSACFGSDSGDASETSECFILQILRENIFAFLYVVFFFVWLLFFMILLIKAVFQNMYIKYLRISAFEAKPLYKNLCADCAYVLGIKTPRILQSYNVKSTFLSGLLHPSIILPAGEQESAMASREVIIHELAHLIRRDYLWNLLCQASKILFPVQPLIWLLSRNIEETSDYVCDDYVILHGNNNRKYAIKLFYLAQSLQPDFSGETSVVGILSSRSPLLRRIERLVNDSYIRRVRVYPTVSVSISLFFFCLIILTGSLSFSGEKELPSLVFDKNKKNYNIFPFRSGTFYRDLLQAIPAKSGKQATRTQDILLRGITEEDVSGNKQDYEISQVVKEFRPEKEEKIPLETIQTIKTAEIQINQNHALEDKKIPEDFEQTVASEKKELTGSLKNTLMSNFESLPETVTEHNDSLFAIVNSGIKWSLGTRINDNNTVMDYPDVPPGPVEMILPTEESGLNNGLLDYLARGPENPIWSPDGKTIAFTGQIGAGIWTVPVEGGEPTLVYDNYRTFEYNGQTRTS